MARPCRSLGLAASLLSVQVCVALLPVRDFRISAAGFKITNARSDELQFAFPLRDAKVDWDRLAVRGLSVAPAKLSPTRLRASGFSEGFEMFFTAGFALRVSSLGAPYLSWQEGSVAPGVLCAPSKFIALSFRDDQPPILFCFPDQLTTMKIDGRPGEWIIRSGSQLSGWVRVIAPFGARGYPTVTAADLGRLVKALQPSLPRWTSPSTRLSEVRANRTADGLVAQFKFDGVGATMPQAWERLILNKSARQVGVRGLLGRPISDGPRVFKKDSVELVLPDVRPLPGRALTSRDPGLPRIVFNDAASVLRLAMANSLSSRSSAVREVAMSELNSFAQRFPNGLQRSAAGTTSELVAAYLLLGQIVAPARRSDWLQTAADWIAWDTLDPAVSAEASGTLALALGLGVSPTMQVRAGLLDAMLELDQAGGMRESRHQIFRKDHPFGEFSTPNRVLSMHSVRGSGTPETVLFTATSLLPGEPLVLATEKKSGPLKGECLLKAIELPGARVWAFPNVPPAGAFEAVFGPPVKLVD
ncbi:MAG: hypothetical protein JNM85_02810 [Chthonomonas sp.]|nr:hypothetical protein [Chthonomonas sp.]